MFPGATALDADSVALASQLRRPGPMDLLHVSGHGDSSITAVISANLLMAGRIAPDGRYEKDPLTDSVIRNQLAFEPTSHPLVFLNCCYLGKMDPNPARLQAYAFAASIAESLIEMGVTAVAAAGWAVGGLSS